MPFDTIVYEMLEDRVARLTLSRPEKLNAMSPQLLREFDEALDAFEHAPDVSVLIWNKDLFKKVMRDSGASIRPARSHPPTRPMVSTNASMAAPVK